MLDHIMFFIMLGSKVIFLVIISYSVFAKLQIIDNDNIKHEHVIHSAIEIANQNFNPRLETVILSKDVEDEIVNKFIKSFQGSVIVEKKDSASPKQVVIIIESYFSLVKILGKLKPDLKGKALLHSGAQFLIIVLSYPHRLQRINSLLWSYYATNVVVIVTDKTKKIALYTFFPYKNRLNCQNIEPSLIGFWDDGAILKKDLFPDKMGDMRGCPLYISNDKYIHPGAELKIPLLIVKRSVVKLLQEVMNFTPIISNRDFFGIDSAKSKNWSAALNDIMFGTANISTCSVSPGVDRVGLLDYSFPYFRIKLAWLAPPLSPGPIWWRLLSPLNGYLWLGILLVVCIVKSIPIAIKIGCVKKFCYRYFKNFDKLHGVVIKIWAVFMGQPIRVEPRRFRDFYILTLWIWFTFVVRSAYQSVLIGALKSDVTYGKFTDLQDVIDDGYQIGGRGGIWIHFEQDPIVKNRFVVIPDEQFDHTFQDMLEGKKKIICAISLEYAMSHCLSRGIKENECGHILPDSIMTVPLVVWMSKNSPFKKLVSDWLIRFLESGLLEKNAIKIPLTTYLKTSEPSALTGNQMLSCMLCLFLGYLISAFILLLEVIRFKTKKIKVIPRRITYNK